MKRILIVEDTALIVVLVKAISQKNNNIICDIATNLNEAEQFIGKNVYDYVLLDLFLGGEWGLNIVSKYKNLKIIITTANSNPSLEKEIRSYNNIIDYIIKPLDYRKLLMDIVEEKYDNILIERDEDMGRNSKEQSQNEPSCAGHNSFVTSINNFHEEMTKKVNELCACVEGLQRMKITNGTEHEYTLPEAISTLMEATAETRAIRNLEIVQKNKPGSRLRGFARRWLYPLISFIIASVAIGYLMDIVNAQDEFRNTFTEVRKEIGGVKEVIAVVVAKQAIVFTWKEQIDKKVDNHLINNDKQKELK